MHGEELLCHQLYSLSCHRASVNWWLVRSTGMASRLHHMSYCVVLGLWAIVHYLCPLTVSWDSQNTCLLGCVMLGGAMLYIISHQATGARLCVYS